MFLSRGCVATSQRRDGRDDDDDDEEEAGDEAQIHD